MVNIKTIAGLMVAILLLSWSTLHYRNNSIALTLEINRINAVSGQIVHDKQIEKETIETRANDFLRKAKQDYEKVNRVNNNYVDRLRGNPKTSTSSSDSVSSIQKPATGIQALDICEAKLSGLWNAWAGLCLMYGCED